MGAERPRRCGLTILTALLFLVPVFLYLQCIRPALPPDRVDGTDGPDATCHQDRGSNLLHSWDDDELFARAVAANSSFVGPRPRPRPHHGSPFFFWAAQQQRRRRQRPAPKIAFLFLTTGRLPFEPLWSEFLTGNEDLFNVYVHSAPFRFDLFPNRSSPFWGRSIPSRPTSRASPSLIAATRRLLANALLDDPNNAYFALLSDSCIPLHGFRRLYKRLLVNSDQQNHSRSFIEVIADSGLLPSRYEARGKGAMLPEIRLSDFRIGSQWFVLSRHHAAMFVGDTKYWPKFNKPCLEESQFSCYPEEHYFSTLMSLLDPRGTHGYSLTRVHWPPDTDGHPATYHGNQVDRGFVQQLQKEQDGRFMFARKFDADALQPLLSISNVLLS